MSDMEYTLNNAVASVEIEGYNVTEDEKRLCMAMLEGKITKEEMIKKVLERCAL